MAGWQAAVNFFLAGTERCFDRHLRCSGYSECMLRIGEGIPRGLQWKGKELVGVAEIGDVGESAFSTSVKSFVLVL